MFAKVLSQLWRDWKATHEIAWWWNLHACLRLPTTEIKADINFLTKNKKQKIILLFCWCVVYLFF